MALSATLNINSVSEPAIIGWQANHPYTSAAQSGYVAQYTSIIKDVNGNYQVAVSGGGLSGSSVDFSGTVPGDYTVDGDITWQCCQLFDFFNTALTYDAVMKVGSSVNLTWTTTDAVSATFNGLDAPLNDDIDIEPDFNNFGDGSNILTFGYFDGIIINTVFTLNSVAQFKLVARDVDNNTYTVTKYFALNDSTSLIELDVAIPIDLSFAGPEGDAGANFCVQRGYGPIWNNPTSYIGCSFEDFPIPAEVIVPLYESDHDYVTGDVVAVPWNDDAPGIPVFVCVQNGKSNSGGFLNNFNTLLGTIISDNTFNPSGTTSTLVWKVIGSISLNLVWSGSTINAPDDYPSYTPDAFLNGDPNAVGPLGDPRLAVPVELSLYHQVRDFISDATPYRTTCEPFNTASIPTSPTDPINWTYTALGSGFINENGGTNLGFRVTINAAVAEFFIPSPEFTSPPPPFTFSQGRIIIKKSTNPNGSTQSFHFIPSWGAPFDLLDGEENDSGLIPIGTYSITEDAVTGWTTETSQDTSNIQLVDGQTITIIFYNTKTPDLSGLALIGDFQEGIGHEKIKWDQWTYHTNCRLLSAQSGNDTYVVTLLDSGKIIRLDSVQKRDYIDGINTNRIPNYAITAGFVEEEGYLNFLYAVLLRVIGEGLLHVSVMDSDDIFAENPENQVDCDPFIMQLRPGKDVQVSPKYQSENYYIKFSCQEEDDPDNAYFTISMYKLYQIALFSERPQ
jgi:hypothetical protein